MEDIKWTKLEEVLNEFGDLVIELARQNLNDNNSNASFNLYNYMEKVVEIGEDEYTVKISLADYWKYVEEGRGPGKFPPPDAIRNWIEIKPLSIQPDLNGRVPTVEQVGFLIGRKIAQEGTEPHPFLEPAVEEALTRMEKKIDEAIEDDIASYIEEEVVRRMEDAFGGK